MYAMHYVEIGMSPGGNMEFEGAPFKLTLEYIELLDGVNSHLFQAFRSIVFLFSFLKDFLQCH